MTRKKLLHACNDVRNWLTQNGEMQKRNSLKRRKSLSRAGRLIPGQLYRIGALERKTPVGRDEVWELQAFWRDFVGICK
jgi:hypothetical protein